MFNNILFVGGIHGVGKSTLCSGVCKTLSITHLTASSLLKWHEVKADVKDKRVNDIEYTQQRLIHGLNKVLSPEGYYLLEGHFTLFDGNGNISQIPSETFLKINPVLVAVVTEDPFVIKDRIEERDGGFYDIAQLAEMQCREINRAEIVAKELGIPICQVSQGKTNKLISVIKTTFSI